MSSIAKQSDSFCCDKTNLTYTVGIKSLHDVICSINESSHVNISYNLSLYFNGNEDYIDLSLIKDNFESIEITYNSNRNTNNIAMIFCENKRKLKEITFNFNTYEKIYCNIINCPKINNIRIVGGNNVLTRINTRSYITIKGCNTNSICVSNSSITNLELENIGDLMLDTAYYMKNSIRIGPITKDIGSIKRLSIEDIEAYI